MNENAGWIREIHENVQSIIQEESEADRPNHFLLDALERASSALGDASTRAEQSDEAT